MVSVNRLSFSLSLSLSLSFAHSSGTEKEDAKEGQRADEGEEQEEHRGRPCTQKGKHPVLSLSLSLYSPPLRFVLGKLENRGKDGAQGVW